MKIGIFTFHCAINYGAVLQAYCLQEYLKSLGHDVYIIDYRPNYLTKPYKTFNYQASPHLSILENAKAFIRALFTAIIRNKRKKRFNLFINQRLRLIDFETAKHSHFDLLVYGSDQIWNPKITEGYDVIYFGAFTGIQCDKKISYAASAGSLQYITKPSMLHTLLCNFDGISVRESSFKDYLESNFGLHATATLDPVLLVNSSTLSDIAAKPNIQNDYLLLFQLRHDESVQSYATQVAKQAGLSLVRVVSDAESLFGDKPLQTLSPEKMLGYIKGATLVLSTSFHGTALSIVFKKQFYAIKSPGNISERIQQLLNNLGLEDRLITPDQIITGHRHNIDYDIVAEQIAQYSKTSIQFLQRFLNQ